MTLWWTLISSLLATVNGADIKGLSEFFPYTISGKVQLRALDDGSATSYSKPGYASIYPKFSETFSLFLYPPRDCLAVYLCFPTSVLNQTNNGLPSLDINTHCQNSLRFLPYEQMVYHFKGGSGTAHVFPISRVELEAGDNDHSFDLGVYSDFDNEDIGEAEITNLEVEIKNQILVLTSSPACHVRLHSDSGLGQGQHIDLADRKALSQYFKSSLTKISAPYIMTGTMDGSKFKSDGPRSLLYDEIKNQKESSDEECCPSMAGLRGFSRKAVWTDRQALAIANSYRIGTLNCGKESADSSPLSSFSIDIGDECEWIRICFDTSDSKWCEKEGNAIHFLFVHGVFIPTDSDQAVALGVDDEALKLLRINFMKKLPAIELSYAFTGSFLPVVTYTMHLAAYSDAGNDPTKLHLHIVKSGSCRARLVSDTGQDTFSSRGRVDQCIVVNQCKCYIYDEKK
ncbi:hypothetical protein Q1695_009366 [Nippostrongylus brasiliensis]|nr:hypothetical protein Q1695_009366 [Nippostrongylus brasiliensis]